MSKRILIASLLLALFFASCQETEDGCLDLLSSNYNFNAVSECDSCCIYPNVVFNYRIDYDTSLSRALLDTFELASNDSIFLNSLKLSTGSFTFVGPNNTYRIRDLIKVNDAFIEDDYILAENTTSYTIGQVRYAGQTNSVLFSVGIDSAEVSGWGSLDNIDQRSNLDMLMDSMYLRDTKKVALMRIDLEVADSLRQLVISSDVALDFDRPIDKSNDFGENITVNIRIDLKSLTQDINATLSNIEMEILIADRIAESITIE